MLHFHSFEINFLQIKVNFKDKCDKCVSHFYVKFQLKVLHCNQNASAGLN